MKEEQTSIGVGKHRVLISQYGCVSAITRLAESAALRGQPMSMATRYEDSNWYLIVEIGEVCGQALSSIRQTGLAAAPDTR